MSGDRSELRAFREDISGREDLDSDFQADIRARIDGMERYFLNLGNGRGNEIAE